MVTEVDEVDKLLVLKAVFLARKILSNPPNIIIAVQMIDVAIETLSKRHGNEEKRRLLFYYLLKCEMADTFEEDVLRSTVKQMAEEIRSSAYVHYLKVLESTRSSKYLADFSTGITADGLEKTEAYDTRLMEWVDTASRVLYVDLKNLSPKQSHFLNKVNLMEMLQHHKIKYP
jgi:hypothetical protein